MDKRVKKRRTIETDGTRVTEEDLDEDSDEGYCAVPFEMIHEKHAVTSEPCWGCTHEFRKPQSLGDNPTLDHLWSTYERNASSMSSKELAALLHVEFLRLVHDPMRERGEPCMMWPERVIRRHIEGKHGLIKSAEIQQSITALSVVEREILDGLFLQKDGKRGFKFDDRRVDSLCKIIMTKQKLLANIKE